MKSLRECLTEAAAEGKAIGHFNFSDLETFRGIFNAAQKMGTPVIFGVSEGERSFVGVRQAAALVESLRKEFDFPAFLNADHCYSFERVKEAIDAGYDSVIFDGAELPFEENLKITRECADYIKRARPGVVLEGELGFIGKSSKIHERIPAGVKIAPEYLTKPEEAAKFARESGIDMLAPAVGNIHGMLEGGIDPALDIKRIAAIREAAGAPLTLHGASGNSAEDIKKAVASGVAVVHINTEIRAAYRRGLTMGLSENPDEISPYKYLKWAVEAVEKVVEEKIKIISGLN